MYDTVHSGVRQKVLQRLPMRSLSDLSCLTSGRLDAEIQSRRVRAARQIDDEDVQQIQFYFRGVSAKESDSGF